MSEFFFNDAVIQNCLGPSIILRRYFSGTFTLPIQSFRTQPFQAHRTYECIGAKHQVLILCLGVQMEDVSARKIVRIMGVRR